MKIRLMYYDDYFIIDILLRRNKIDSISYGVMYFDFMDNLDSKNLLDNFKILCYNYYR